MARDIDISSLVDLSMGSPSNSRMMIVIVIIGRTISLFFTHTYMHINEQFNFFHQYYMFLESACAWVLACLLACLLARSLARSLQRISTELSCGY